MFDDDFNPVSKADDAPPEVWAEFEATLDEYIQEWSKQVTEFAKEYDKETSKGVGPTTSSVHVPAPPLDDEDFNKKEKKVKKLDDSFDDQADNSPLEKSFENYVPPQEVQRNATKAVQAQVADGSVSKGDEGIMSLAAALANGEPMDVEQLQTINDYLVDHSEAANRTEWPDHGAEWQEWFGMGGRAGLTWTRKCLRSVEKYNTCHARNSGKFCSGSKMVVADIRGHGGITYNVVRGSSPKNGMLVSPYPTREHIISGRACNAKDVKNYIKANRDLLTKPGHYLGGWYDPATKRTYLDVSVRTTDRAKADKIARQAHQEAFFDLGSMKTIVVHARVVEKGEQVAKTKLVVARIPDDEADFDAFAEEFAAALQPEDNTIEKVFTGEISKIDKDKHEVFGWASIVEEDGKPLTDRQGDIMTPADLEKMAYSYVLDCRVGGEMHVKKGIGKLIESTVFTEEKQKSLGIDLGFVGWWVGFHVDDADVWEKVKDGTYKAFSIHGKGIREKINQ